MERMFGIAQDTSGNIIPSATVTVNLAGTSTLATLFSDNAYTPQTNPFTSETDGAYQFYAQNGRYDVVLTKTSYTFDDDDTANIILADGASVISPAQITSNQNNYSPTNALSATTWRINSDATRNITGIAAGNAQQRITLTNVGSFDIVLPNQSASSAAANRFTFPLSRPVTLVAGTSVTLVYDGTSTTWRLRNSTAQITNAAVLDALTVPVSFSNTAAAQTYYTYSVRGGTLGTDGVLRLIAFFRLVNTTGAPVTIFPTITYGGSTVGTAPSVLSCVDGAAAPATMLVTFYLSANAATNAQIGNMFYGIGETASSAVGAEDSAMTTAAVDSTANQNLVVQGTMGTASANATLTLNVLTLERLR